MKKPAGRDRTRIMAAACTFTFSLIRIRDWTSERITVIRKLLMVAKNMKLTTAARSRSL